MATVERLMGVGVPAEIAKRIGFFIHDTFISAQSKTIDGPGNQLVRVSATGVTITFGSKFDVGDKIVVVAHVTTTVVPASNHFIWPASAGIGHSINASVTHIIMKIDNTLWQVIGTDN